MDSTGNRDGSWYLRAFCQDAASSHRNGVYNTLVPHFGQCVLPVLRLWPFLFPHSRQNIEEQEGQTNFLASIELAAANMPERSPPENIMTPGLPDPENSFLQN